MQRIPPGPTDALAPPDPLSRRERRKLEVRGRILDAAKTLFSDQGIEATKVIEICERADVAHKTFFNYFPSKRHLLRELAQEGLANLLADIEQACKQPVSTSDRIRYFFALIAANADEVGPMHREMLTEMVHVAHEAGTESEQARQLHDAFGVLVSEGRAIGDVTEDHDDETLTEMLMGAFYVLMFNWANLDDYPLRERALRTAEFLVTSMVLPDACKKGE